MTTTATTKKPKMTTGTAVDADGNLFREIVFEAFDKAEAAKSPEQRAAGKAFAANIMRVIRNEQAAGRARAAAKAAA